MEGKCKANDQTLLLAQPQQARCDNSVGRYPEISCCCILLEQGTRNITRIHPGAFQEQGGQQEIVCSVCKNLIAKMCQTEEVLPKLYDVVWGSNKFNQDSVKFPRQQHFKGFENFNGVLEVLGLLQYLHILGDNTTPSYISNFAR
jgi:hypothetical protein